MVIEHKIIKQFFTVGYEDKHGFQKELNLVSWNNGMPKYDLRGWDISHTKMTKGTTFSGEELEQLREELNQMFIEEV